MTRPPTDEYLGFLAAYEPRITEIALAVRALVLEEAPDAVELLYDAYNAVAAGYSFTGRPSDGFIHIAAYAKWVNLGFNFGSQLTDPRKVLRGEGKWIRHLRMTSPEDVARPGVREFVREAAAKATRPKTEQAAGGSVVRAVYKRRRRPV